ncbi:LOW QUALITY PROTEIN: spermine oxidase [Aphomia sociella]
MDANVLSSLILSIILTIASVGDASIMKTSQSYDTIVIGLGSAGTTAASTLARAGKRVLALEAQDRVGGRVHTVPFGDGVVELGAEWIHGTNHSRVYELAIQNNVSVLPQHLDLQPFRSDGGDASSSLLNELINFVLQVVDEPPETAQPLGQYITERVRKYLKEKHPSVFEDEEFVQEFLHFADLIINNYEATTSWNDITTESKYEELGGCQHMSWNRHGYKTFFEILLNKYNNGPGLPTLEIKLNTEVINIKYSQDPNAKVTVLCLDGSTYTADNVIITVSLGVLKERHEKLFTPQLTQEKTAIDKMSMGLLGKVILLFPNQWWEGGHYFGFLWRDKDKKQLADVEKWLYALVVASPPMGTSKTLTFWTTGDIGRMVETLPEDLVKRKCMELLRRFMGRNITIPEPTAMLRSTWNSNPFTRGSYTYDNIISPQYPTAREDLGKPLTDSSGRPRVLFAGEATNPNHFSTVHGASDTGYREALRLLPKSKI